MDSGKVLYSKGKNDECLTPAYGVQPILEYIPAGKIVWCPFDLKNSWFVKLISQKNPVVYSHLSTGEDFFKIEPKSWDLIISNPPFTNKRLIFERAIGFKKPFALLMTNTWLNDAAPKQLFKDKELQLLMFDKRIEFNNQSKITFSSSYFCWQFLPKQIMIKYLDKN